jgi:hypothetical protein
MKRFTVYQQVPPIGAVANFVRVGEIEAETGAQAIDKAKSWTHFVVAAGLARFPVVAPEGDLKWA